jgi:hypothetical protein
MLHAPDQAGRLPFPLTEIVWVLPVVEIVRRNKTVGCPITARIANAESNLTQCL